MGGQGQSRVHLDEPALESLLAFWAEAGVDVLYADEPVNRAAEPARPLRTEAAPVLVQPTVQAKAGPDISAAMASARELAAAAADLTALETAIAAFEGCPLKFEGARRAVFSRGAADGPVMVIGEAPSGDDDIEGLPFAGRPGKLLDKIFAAAGLTGRVFITNTVFWRTPGGRPPTPAEQLVCQPFLDRAIELVSPKFLLLVGGASAKAVLKREEGILTLHGRWFEWTAPDGSRILPALPTLHPSFLLRQPAAKKKAWQDMLTLTERLDRPQRPA